MESCPNKTAKVCGVGHREEGWVLNPQVVASKMTLCMRTEPFRDREPRLHSGPRGPPVAVGTCLDRARERQRERAGQPRGKTRRARHTNNHLVSLSSGTVSPVVLFSELESCLQMFEKANRECCTALVRS